MDEWLIMGVSPNSGNSGSIHELAFHSKAKDNDSWKMLFTFLRNALYIFFIYIYAIILSKSLSPASCSTKFHYTPC